jgi:di/tricarboxylate transporter
VLAVARQGQRLRERLGKIRFAAGDILLLQAREDQLQSTLSNLGCLPLASRGLRITAPRQVLLASSIFAVALALIALGVVPAAIALVGAALVMVLVRLVPSGEIYKSIDMSIIVLIAAMLPIGEALETTGGSRLIADALLEIGQAAPPAATVAILMVGVMLLSNGQQRGRCGARRARGDQLVTRHGGFCRSAVDGGGHWCILRLPHAHRSSVKHPGDGSGRLPLR